MSGTGGTAPRTHRIDRAKRTHLRVPLACWNALDRRSAHNIRAVSANALNPPNPHECWATPKEIAALIRQAREDRKLTQHALAQRMGKKQAEVARWESGATIVKMPTLSRIAEALGFELVVHFGPRTSA